MKIFTIRDKKAEGYNTPFCQPTFGLAERAFQDALKDPQNIMSKHAEDFSLWHVGDMDLQTAEVIPCHPPKLICEATN